MNLFPSEGEIRKGKVGRIIIKHTLKRYFRLERL